MKPIEVYFLNCKRSARFAVMVLLLLIAGSATRLHAQGYGTISGTVTDPTGAVVPSANVTATQIQTGRETVATAGKDGLFVFTSLPPSAYSLSVAVPGFETYHQSGIILQANQALTVNVKLQVGASTATVEVAADAPQVDTTTGTLSQVIDRDRVVDLPLNGRNAASLITLVAGVVDATNEGNGANQGNGKTFPAAVISSTNGTLPNQSNYLLDGGNNVDEMTNVNGPFPFPDALQEFSVQTSNYNAEYGQSAGAVVNIVTKSGGRQFHGTAFEFLRNGYFNARPYFATVADNLHRHQFGGTIGGPVIIPHLSTGARTQFFFGYQHTLIHQNSNCHHNNGSDPRGRRPRSRHKSMPISAISAPPVMTQTTSATSATPTRYQSIHQRGVSAEPNPFQRLRSCFGSLREGLPDVLRPREARGDRGPRQLLQADSSVL